MKRSLTENEIENILSFIKERKSIPVECAESIVKITRKRLKSYLEKQLVYPEIIPELKKQIEKEYNSSQITPGESVGILAAQAIGEKNTQSSVSYHEEIMIRKNNIITRTKIGEFIDFEMKKGNVAISNHSLIKSTIDENIEIMSISNDEKVEWKKITELSKHPPLGDLIKVKTESGRTVVVTLSHSLLIKQNNNVVPIKGSELKLFEKIPVIKQAQQTSSEYMLNEVELIGLLLCCGNRKQNRIELNIEKNHHYAETILQSNNIKYTRIYQKLVIHSIDSTSMYKRIPSFIYGLKLDLITHFLNAFTFQYNRFIASNKKIMIDLQQLLTLYGIYSVLEQRIDTLVTFRLKIQEKDRCRVVGTINEYYSFVPDFEEIHDDLNNILNINKQRKLTQYDLIDLINNCEDKYVLDCLEQSFYTDVVWEKVIEIKTIKEMDYQYSHVYDFSVENNETFALYSGIIVHNTLNTFHKAGQNEKSVTQGVPRFQELLNATKSPKVVNCKIYFKKGNKTIGELRETVNHQIVCLRLKDLALKMEIKMNKEKEKWYDAFAVLYDSAFTEYQHCISIQMNITLMYKYRIEMLDVAKKIEEEYNDLHCVFSSINVGQLDIFVDMTKIKFTEKQLLFITEENSNEIYLDECVMPQLENMIVFGIEGIENIYFIKEDDEWILETDGSNFKKLLGNPIVNMTKVLSNNVWDIYETLGIEAARQFLLQEFESIMDGINICHVKLLVEKMTFIGSISSISRYTLRKDESGPLSKASFEESVEHMVKSAFAGDVEKTKGISASIICGKRASIGTGFVDLKINMKKILDAKPVVLDNIQ